MISRLYAKRGKSSKNLLSDMPNFIREATISIVNIKCSIVVKLWKIWLFNGDILINE